MARVVMCWLVLLAALGAESLEIEGKLLQVTPTPELGEIAPYPRALCTYLYEVQKVHAGEYADDKILVVKWAVWKREKVAGLPKKAGTVERLRLERWIEQARFQRERIVDAIGQVERVIYYDPSSRPAERPGVGEILKGREKELEAGVVRGAREGWLFLGEELRHAATGRFWEKDWKEVSRAGVDPLAAMLDFQRRLKELGVELLIVPVPTKVSVYPECLAEGTDVTSQSDYLRRLELAGLNVIDLEAGFLKRRNGDPTLKLYCAQDSHWTPAGCAAALEEVFAMIDLPAEEEVVAEVELVREMRIGIHGDLARMLPSPGLRPEILTIDQLKFRDGRKSLGFEVPNAKCILLGDSHVTVFSEGGEEMHGAGAGLPDCLLVKGLPVDVIASHGDGVNQARVNLYQQRTINPKYPNYWKNKKWVIWVFAARQFTRAERWSTKIPVGKKS